MSEKNRSRLNLGETFQPESQHLPEILNRRNRTNDGRIPLGVSFLDDCLGGIYPRDLMLIGASTGAGKTDVAVKIAMAGVAAGKRVFLFCLEADRGEIAERLMYERLAALETERQGHSYAGWRRKQCPWLDKHFSRACKELEGPLGKLNTRYNMDNSFSNEDLYRELKEIREEVDLVVLDHVHMLEGTGKENQVQKKTISLLREMALDAEVPVVAISHLRKKGGASREKVMPEIDDLHGSSELSKIATQVVLLAPDYKSERVHRHQAPTLIQVVKDRRGRTSPYIARINYDLRTARYVADYELGVGSWEKGKGVCWAAIPESKVPTWAAHCSSGKERNPL